MNVSFESVCLFGGVCVSLCVLFVLVSLLPLHVCLLALERAKDVGLSV